MARKGENIYKRKDGRWEGRYVRSRTSDGKIRYGYIYAPTHKEARKKLLKTAVFHELHPAQHTDPACTLLFPQAAAQWLEAVRPGIKESSYQKYRNLLESYLCPEFRNTPLSSMSAEVIDSFCSRLLQSGGAKEQGLSAKTVSDALSVIRSIFRYAARNGENVSCTADSVRIRQCPKEMRILSRSEQEKLCRFLYSDPTGCNMGILLSLFTGLRIGEVCALRWEDISSEEKTIHIHQTMQRLQIDDDSGQKTRVMVTSPKSLCSVRTIPLPDHLSALIAEYQKSREGYFLTNSTVHFIEPRTLQNHFKNVLKKAVIAPVNFHALRHTFATRCVELGFDVKSLSEILGHSNVSITMNRYVHPSMELKKENMQRLSSLFTVS